MKRQAIALLFATLALQASAEVQLLPAGTFKGRDGRPGADLAWSLTDAQGQALAQRLNARHASVDFQFDYEHQNMLAKDNGQPAPASAWATRFEWRSGQGLWALNVQWTARARQMIEDGEYKYLSPLIVYNKDTGMVLDVLNAALVGRPNLDLDPVGLAQLAQLNASLLAPNFDDPAFINQENLPMTKLLALLGLAATATEDAACAALDALKTTADAAIAQLAALNTQLGLKPDGTAQDAASAIAALSAKAITGDATTQTAMAALQGQVAALSAANLQREVDAEVLAALQAGRLLPAQKEWAIKLGQTDMAQLRAFVANAPAVGAALAQGQSGGQEPQKDAAGNTLLTPQELAMCGLMGLTQEQFRAAAQVAA